jgi:hypothetical protein
VLFPTHLVGGYLAGRPWSLPTVWVLAGAALPDLVDKPLGMAGLAPLYQTVGHSALTLVVVVLAGLATVGRDRRLVGVAVGWGSHLLLDVAGMALNGRPANWVLVLWPLTEKPAPLALGPLAFYRQYVGSPAFYAELLVWVAGLYALWRSPAVRRYVDARRSGHSR